MTPKSPFDPKHIKESAYLEPSGLLDQFNLPPAFVAFLRKNQRTIWITIGCISVIVIAVSLYGSYRVYRQHKAGDALTMALRADGAEKEKQLHRIIDEYGSTDSALWSRVELSHIAALKGDTGKAIQEMTTVNSSVSGKNPLKPLVLFNLGALYMKNNDLEHALASYRELSAFKGFEAHACEAMGRVYEMQKKTKQAIEMYKKFLSLTETENGIPARDPERIIVREKVRQLQE